MRLKPALINFLIVCLVSVPLYGTAAADATEWSIEEVTTIGEGKIIQVAPGSSIRFKDSKSKLNIFGELRVKGSRKNPSIITMPNPLNRLTAIRVEERTLLRSNAHLKELEIYPYSIETDEALEELRAFRYQYAFVWTVLMGICFYLVINRSTYW
jgi:hypothetical protein